MADPNRQPVETGVSPGGASGGFWSGCSWWWWAIGVIIVVIGVWFVLTRGWGGWGWGGRVRHRANPAPAAPVVAPNAR